MDGYTPYGLTLKQYYLMNSMFLLAHVLYAIWYSVERMPILFYYNLFSIAIFLLGYVTLKVNGPKYIMWMNFIEIFVFMAMNVLVLGWGYGFQFFCIGFAVSGLLVDFILNHKKEMTPLLRLGFVILMFSYVALYLWCQGHAPVYVHGNPYIRMAIYLGNTMSSVSLIIGLLWSSMNQVYDLEGKLVDASEHDVLTGLHNRRYMQDFIVEWKKGVAGQAGQAGVAGQHDAWVAIIDIDHFKNVNDTYGHFAGDHVLKQLGHTLLGMEQKNPNLLAMRWGGEEFCLFYHSDGGAGQDVPQLLEDLRRTFQSQRYHYEGQSIALSVTIGAAQVEGANVEAAEKLADARLYWGKEHGRNQVVCQGLDSEE